MPKLTWSELQLFIEENIENKNEEIFVYDLNTGETLACDIIELKDNDTWKPFISINSDSLETE